MTHRWALDGATRTHTLVGQPLAYYVKDRRLWRVALAGPAPAIPQPATVEADVCGVLRAIELDLTDGHDAWVETERSGPDGDCVAAADNRRTWVRTATGASVHLPDGSTLVEPLRDAAGRLLHLLVHDARHARLELRAASTMAPGALVDAADAGIQAAERFADDPASPLALHLRVNGNQLRRLTWSATSAQLGASLHVFITAGSPRGVTDARAMYFGDGPAVWRIAAGSALPTRHAALLPADGSVTAIDLAADQLLVSQGWPRPTLHLVRTAPGAPVVRLAGGTADARIFTFVGGQGGAVVYTAAQLAAGPSAASLMSHAVFRVAPGATVGVAGPAPVAFAGVEPAREHRFGTGTAAAALWCPMAADATAPDCAGRELERLDIASGAVTTLGTFPTAARSARLFVSTSTGAAGPMVLQASWLDATTGGAPLAVDLWLVSPGTAAGLVRVGPVRP